MPLPYRNRAILSDNDPRLVEALDDIVNHVQSVMTQTNSSPNGQAQAPVAPSSLNVTAAHGIFDASITDNNPVARGINYFLEYSEDPGFSKPITVDLGQSRNYRVNLGNQTLYWRSHSSYPTGPRSQHVYHGGPSGPKPVVGGGNYTGPPLQLSQGSGTSSGASGSDGAFGNKPFRGSQRPTNI